MQTTTFTPESASENIKLIWKCRPVHADTMSTFHSLQNISLASEYTEKDHKLIFISFAFFFFKLRAVPIWEYNFPEYFLITRPTAPPDRNLKKLWKFTNIAVEGTHILLNRSSPCTRQYPNIWKKKLTDFEAHSARLTLRWIGFVKQPYL